jgi:hypothetical protein
MEIIGQRQRGQRKKYCPTAVTTNIPKNTAQPLSLFGNTAPRNIHVKPHTHRKTQSFVTTLIHAAPSSLRSLCVHIP